MLFRRLVVALEAIGTAWQRENELSDASNQVAREQMQMQKAQQATLETVQQQQGLQLERAAEWRAVELEHMQRCERRFALLKQGQAVDHPVTH